MAANDRVAVFLGPQAGRQHLTIRCRHRVAFLTLDRKRLTSAVHLQQVIIRRRVGRLVLLLQRGQVSHEPGLLLLSILRVNVGTSGHGNIVENAIFQPHLVLAPVL